MIKAQRCISSLTTLTALCLLLAGCGGDDDPAVAGASAPPPSASPPPSGSAPPPPSNGAPTISGTPLTSVMQGNAYSFTPSASDPDGGDTLTFSVANLPGWANFNPNTGRLNGTPSAADVGTYANVTISVSDGTANASLVAFSIQVVGTATGSATLTWTPPTENTDGSPLTNLAGYKVHWGTSQSNFTNSVTIDKGTATYVVDQLTPATWYFALTAINSAGAESAFSNVASKTVR